MIRKDLYQELVFLIIKKKAIWYSFFNTSFRNITSLYILWNKLITYHGFATISALTFSDIVSYRFFKDALMAAWIFIEHGRSIKTVLGIRRANTGWVMYITWAQYKDGFGSPEGDTGWVMCRTWAEYNYRNHTINCFSRRLQC